MSNPVNNGQKVYTLLVEYSSLTGLPTGNVRPNVPTDPHYIGPVTDHISCPTGGSNGNRNVSVVQQGGFENWLVKLVFGLNQLTQDTAGVWVVPDRTYDGAIFQIPIPPAQTFQLSVEYGSNQKKLINCVAGGNFFIPGPFAQITKLKMFASVGDFNDDFNEDYSS